MKKSLIIIVVVMIYFFPTESMAVSPDFDKNGKTDMSDAILGLQVIAGLRSGVVVQLSDVISVLRVSAGIPDVNFGTYQSYQGNWKGKASKIGDKQASFGAILFNPISAFITSTEIKFQIDGNNIKGEWVMWSGLIGFCNPLDPSYWSNPACTNPFKPILWSNFEGTCTFSDKIYCNVNNKEWKDSTDITGILNSDSMSVKFIAPGQTEPFITADSIKKSI